MGGELCDFACGIQYNVHTNDMLYSRSSSVGRSVVGHGRHRIEFSSILLDSSVQDRQIHWWESHTPFGIPIWMDAAGSQDIQNTHFKPTFFRGTPHMLSWQDR